MEFAFFHQFFPKIGKKETRFLTILDDKKVPEGHYGILPSFCMDKKCDCRRAFINVMQMDPKMGSFHAATISYGWESLGFYRKWSYGMDTKMLKEFKGPALDRFQKQSKYATHFLSLFTEILLNDKIFLERLPRHYVYFKQKIGMKLPKELKRLIDEDGDCPCKSGKDFKNCCGKQKRRFRRRLR